MKVNLPPVGGPQPQHPDGLNPHEARVEFGKHKGQLLTRLPPGYLRWAVQNEVDGKVRLRDGKLVPLGTMARIEIERRGERIGTMEVSAHAIDRLSTKFIGHWAQSGEGLYSWAEREAVEAWEKREELEAKQQEDGAWQIPWKGIVWVIDELVIPVVKTVK